MIELEQRTTGRAVWTADDRPFDPAWPGWTFSQQPGQPAGEGIIVTVSLTHDVSGAVARYAAEALPDARETLDARIASAPGALAVACGHHAFWLAESLTARIKTMRDAMPGQRIHLFMAVLGAFSFFLGQRAAALGPVTLYEYDFEGATAAHMRRRCLYRRGQVSPQDIVIGKRTDEPNAGNRPSASSLSAAARPDDPAPRCCRHDKAATAPP